MIDVNHWSMCHSFFTRISNNCSFAVFELHKLTSSGYVCVQSKVEMEIQKLKEKIAKTKDQLAQLYPKYDTERRNEEHAASQ